MRMMVHVKRNKTDHWLKNLAWMKRSSYWLVKAFENFLWNSLANLDFS